MKKTFCINASLAAVTVAAAVFLNAPASARDPERGSSQTVQGLTFAYGIVPPQIVQAHPEQHAEQGMHKGQKTSGGKHIVLALFDAESGQRVTRAKVVATVSLLGGSTVTKELEAMPIAGQASFGGFFPLGVPGVYRIRFEVARPGNSGLSVAEFEHTTPR